MRGTSLLLIMLAAALALPGSAAAVADASSTTGGAAYKHKRSKSHRPTVPGHRAVRLKDGRAAAPEAAPHAVRAAVWAANEIVGKPYAYGGGHGRSFKAAGYDCSGTISYALGGAGLLRSPLDSGSFMSWGRPRKGRWITVYTNPGHAYAVIAGLRLDTSSAGERRSSGEGPRWRKTVRGPAGFVARHPKGL
jgi:hypothetical protein